MPVRQVLSPTPSIAPKLITSHRPQTTHHIRSPIRLLQIRPPIHQHTQRAPLRLLQHLFHQQQIQPLLQLRPNPPLHQPRLLLQRERELQERRRALLPNQLPRLQKARQEAPVVPNQRPRPEILPELLVLPIGRMRALD